MVKRSMPYHENRHMTGRGSANPSERAAVMAVTEYGRPGHEGNLREGNEWNA